jgi:CDP-diacylglycerol--glycerol-3-phosphate 3-phosphatidyltransferase
VFRQLFALLNLTLILGAAGISMRSFFRAHADTTAVRGSRMLSSRVRAWYFSNLDPFEDLFVRCRVQPAVLSYGQLFLSVAAGLAYAGGLIFTAGFLVLATGTLDILDGRLARRIGGDSPRGAFLDSVIDRYAEFIGFFGLIAFFPSDWREAVVILAVLGGMMVSYARARAEGLGLRCEVGVLQRPERFVILGFGSIFSSILAQASGSGEQILLEATVVLLAVLSNLTALQRIAWVLRELRGPNHA